MDLEHIIFTFVKQKTGEKVVIDLQDDIIVRPVSKAGSTALAIFWLNVLQHSKNYPLCYYEYKKCFDEICHQEKILLKAGGLQFSIMLKCGTLLIRSKDVYDWFRKHFITLLENYGSQSLPNPCECIHCKLYLFILFLPSFLQFDSIK